VQPAAEVDQLRAMLADRDATIALQAKTIVALTAKQEMLEVLVGKLVEQQSRNSTNSNLPPSSDGPGGSPKPSKKAVKKGGKRGAQKGHKGSHRALVPADRVDKVVDMFPARCDDCQTSLPKTPDADPKRHQHTELAPFVPYITEFLRHEVCCPQCGHGTRAHYDDDVIPRHAFGHGPCARQRGAQRPGRR